MIDQKTIEQQTTEILPTSDAQESDAPEQTPEAVTGEATVLSICAMEPNDRSEVLSQILSHFVNGYAAQDYVRRVSVHPDDVEFVSQWLNTIDMPPMVRHLADVVPNDGTKATPGIIVQSQIETEWLSQHFEDLGLVDYLKSCGAPVMLAHKDLKLLFLLRAVQECESKRRKILLPN